MASKNTRISQMPLVDDVRNNDYLEVIRQVGVGQYDNFRMLLDVVRGYKEGRFHIGNDNEAIILDPVNKTFSLVVDGVEGDLIAMSDLDQQLEAATIEDIVHDTDDDVQYVTPKALVDFALELGFVYDTEESKWVRVEELVVEPEPEDDEPEQPQ